MRQSQGFVDDKRAAAFVPGHISGFFEICDEASEPQRKGSRNCGPCISAGVHTEVEVKLSGRVKAEVFINGKKAPEAQTTMFAVNRILHMAPGAAAKVVVKHSVDVPIGAGYGSSGAGALGAALALSKALGMRLTLPQIIAIAHEAEVACGTGLGDVGAQALGGLVVGLEPGAPPHGKWRRIPTPEDIKIICGTLAPLPTKELLGDQKLRARSKKFGALALERLMKDQSPQGFMMVSYEFAEALGLLDDEIRSLIKAAISGGALGASMVMLGKAAFAFVRASKLDSVRNALLEIIEPDAILVADLDRSGARPA